MSQDCGCGPAAAPVPARTENRPGLPALHYRVGTHATFLRALLDGISTVAVPAGEGPDAGEARPLAALTVRGTDDPTIALLDAWATVADVLTFYQERIANEGYLRTATERRSLLELARLTGYSPRPGVAASVHLAFDLDDGYRLELPAGTRALSVPAPGETMQAFETGEPLHARAEWNRLVPRATVPSVLLPTERHRELFLQGIATGVAPGDLLLLDFTTRQSVHRVTEVHPDHPADRTRVVLYWAAEDTGPARPPEETVDRVPTTDAPAAAIPAGTVLELLGRTAETLARSRVRGSTAEARALRATVEEVSAAGETVGLSEVERAYATVDSASATVAGRNATLDAQMESARTELASLVETYRQPSAATAERTAAEFTAAREDATGLWALLNERQVYAESPSSSALQGAHTGALAAGSAVGANLLAALNPRLGKNLFAAWKGVRVPAGALRPASVYVFRVKAAPFGATAPPPAVTVDTQCSATSIEWALAEEFDAETGSTLLTLDGVYDRILPGSWVAVRSASRDDEQFFRITGVDTVARASYGLGGRATRLALDGVWLPRSERPANTAGPAPGLEVLRDLTVYAQAEPLPLARRPVTADMGGGEIELDALYDGLAPGRWIIVSGERTDLPGVAASELAMIAGVRHGTATVALNGREVPLPGDHVHTWITLSAPLAFTYLRSTVQIFGNVAAATHGETREQVLGSGDAGKALQRFQLMQGPLTWVPAATPSGIQSTLTVRVDQVRWDQAPHLAALGPHSREYLVRTDHEDATSVTFGDGVHGARLPTGHENVRAVYRTGIGAAGNVAAGQVSLLATRPQGLKGVVNPLPASGGGDRDTAEQIRRNAPLGLLSLERIVSVEDYTDFVRAFAGIGKARAAFLTDGRRPVVHVTFAGVDDAPIADDSALATHLAAALRRYGDPHRYLAGGPRDLRALVVSARVRVRADVLWENVEPLARAAMLDHFGFARRELGQGVGASEVVGVLQGVPGVEAVDLDLLAAIGEAELRENPDALAALATGDDAGDGDLAGGGDGGGARWVRRPWVPAAMARLETPPGGGRPRIAPAQLVVLAPAVPDTLILAEWKR